MRERRAPLSQMVERERAQHEQRAAKLNASESTIRPHHVPIMLLLQVELRHQLLLDVIQKSHFLRKRPCPQALLQDGMRSQCPETQMLI